MIFIVINSQDQINWPEDSCPKLIDLLSNCGIVIVFLPHIGGLECICGKEIMNKQADYREIQ